MPKKKARRIPPKLTEAEQDLLAHVEQGYQLATDSLGENPVPRRLKDGEVLRPLSATGKSTAPWHTISCSNACSMNCSQTTEE